MPSSHHHLFFILLTSVLISITWSAPAPSPVSIGRRGQCTGLAFNYIRSVANIQDCLQHCDCDERCQHYSYHQGEGGPHHTHCYLYQACSSFRYDMEGSHWSSGSRSTSPKCPSSSLIPPMTAFFRAS